MRMRIYMHVFTQKRLRIQMYIHAYCSLACMFTHGGTCLRQGRGSASGSWAERACQTYSAYETMVLGLLRPGYHAIRLRSPLGTHIEGCSLLVHIEIGSESHRWQSPTEQVHGLKLKLAAYSALLEEQAQQNVRPVENWRPVETPVRNRVVVAGVPNRFEVVASASK